MAARSPRRIAPAALALFALAACAGRSPSASRAVSPIGGPVRSPAEIARADSGRPPYTAADVRFMTGMIPHHAQAVLMARWAPTHGASSALRILCERIVVAQLDEIASMQRWLRDRGQPVPDGDPSHFTMPGMTHTLMPGMLTATQLTQLNAARGVEFDRLFLTFMIQHHLGAITMVEQLFGSQGAGQDEDMFKFASDVHVDQITEIERMEGMLASLPPGGRSP